MEGGKEGKRGREKGGREERARLNSGGDTVWQGSNMSKVSAGPGRAGVKGKLCGRKPRGESVQGKDLLPFDTGPKPCKALPFSMYFIYCCLLLVVTLCSAED